MNIKHIIVVFSLSMSLTSALYAQADKKSSAPKSGARYLKMLESYSQRILPGARGMQPRTETHFILVWKSKDAPATFFWRGANGWMSCNMVKVHKIKPAPKEPNMPEEEYVTEDITRNPIKKGDTLEVTPVQGGKFPIPKEIPISASNTLFFKTIKSNWLSFPVTKITAKPDIALP